MLVGRERDTQRLLELVDPSDLAPGMLRLIQLDGPLGIGKSSLLAHTLAYTATRGFLVRGNRLYEDAPLGAMRTLLETLLGEDLEALLHHSTPRALATPLSAALSSESTLIAVEDVQWLDAASQYLLTEVMLAPGSAALIVLLVHRPEHEPTELVSAARRRGAQHEHLTLSGVDDDAIEQMVAGLRPQQLRAVVEVAAGNPLFARTAYAGFRRHPSARRVDEVLRLEEGSQSAVLSAAILDDVESLSEPARTVIEALAVLGSASEDHLVAGLTGLSPPESLAAAQELTERGLLSTGVDESLHPVVRYSVYQSIDAPRRIDAHRRAAELTGEEPLTRAEHLAHASAHLTEREAEVLTDAARLAIVSEPHTVLRWLTRVPAELRGTDAETLLARAEILTGEITRAAERLHRLLEAEDTVEVRLLLANALRIRGDLHEARSVLAAAEHPDQPVDAEVLRELIDVVELIDGRAPSELLDRLAKLPGVENRVTAEIYRVLDQLAAGEVRAARESFAGVSEWLQAADAEALRPLLHPVACAAWCAYMLDEYSTGAELAERALTIAQRSGQADALPNLGVAVAFSRAQLAQIPEAEAAAHQAILDAEYYATGEVEAMARAALVIAAQAQAHTDPPLLRRRYQELLDSDIPRFGWWRRAVLTTLTRASALLGEPELRAELLGEPHDAMAPLRYGDAGLAAAVHGDRELTLSLLNQGRELAERHGSHGQRAMLDVTEAELLLRSTPAPGETLPTCRELLTGARTVFEQLGMALQLGRTHAALARLAAAETAEADPLAQLTRRERQIAEQIAAGLTSREIADHFTLSPRTVENHTANLMRKLELSSRTGVIALVQRRPR